MDYQFHQQLVELGRFSIQKERLYPQLCIERVHGLLSQGRADLYLRGGCWEHSLGEYRQAAGRLAKRASHRPGIIHRGLGRW